VHAPPASFYFDLSSPLCYLAAERILHVLPGPAEWQPVLAFELAGPARIDGSGCGEPRHPSPGGADQDAFRARIARAARELGLQPVRWPDPFPFDSSLAMRVATYAKSIGRAVPFAQAAFRQAFAGGRSLADPNFVLIAAAACEMHPAAVLRGAELRTVADRLAAVTAAASRSGVLDVPAVVVPSPQAGGPAEVFLGRRAVEQAAAHMSAGAGAPAGAGG
jgi:2-hydroxychromene-2-carboxylate isomerase